VNTPAKSLACAQASSPSLHCAVQPSPKMFRDSVGPADDASMLLCVRVTKVPQLPLRNDYVKTLGRKRGISATQPACAVAQRSITGLIRHECMRGLPLRGRLSLSLSPACLCVWTSPRSTHQRVVGRKCTAVPAHERNAIPDLRRDGVGWRGERDLMCLVAEGALFRSISGLWRNDRDQGLCPPLS
jgi:hypothetical protein